VLNILCVTEGVTLINYCASKQLAALTVQAGLKDYRIGYTIVAPNHKVEWYRANPAPLFLLPLLSILALPLLLYHLFPPGPTDSAVYAPLVT